MAHPVRPRGPTGTERPPVRSRRRSSSWAWSTHGGSANANTQKQPTWRVVSDRRSQVAPTADVGLDHRRSLEVLP